MPPKKQAKTWTLKTLELSNEAGVLRIRNGQVAYLILTCANRLDQFRNRIDPWAPGTAIRTRDVATSMIGRVRKTLVEERFIREVREDEDDGKGGVKKSKTKTPFVILLKEVK